MGKHRQEQGGKDSAASGPLPQDSGGHRQYRRQSLVSNRTRRRVQDGRQGGSGGNVVRARAVLTAGRSREQAAVSSAPNMEHYVTISIPQGEMADYAAGKTMWTVEAVVRYRPRRERRPRLYSRRLWRYRRSQRVARRVATNAS